MVKRISTEATVQAWQAGLATIVDIRDPQSYAMGHIPGSFHLTDATLPDLLQQVDDDTPIIVVCYHGISSQGAAHYLLGQGYTDVASMDGGFTAWAHQYPDHISRL